MTPEPAQSNAVQFISAKGARSDSNAAQRLPPRLLDGPGARVGRSGEHVKTPLCGMNGDAPLRQLHDGVGFLIVPGLLYA
jgi:hypothetical protein